MASSTKFAKKGSSRWQFIIHGGCSESCPDVHRQREISRNLHEIAEKVSKALEEGSSAKDAVVLAVSALEDCPVFNAGHGAALNQDGIHQLEAGIVDGSLAGYGAVGCMETTKNPILLANALLEHGPHTMLVGHGADDMAKELGLETVANSYFTTPSQKEYWEKPILLKQKEAESHMGTVGAVVFDSRGHLAAGGSTGGPTGKKNGRIGDTAVLGAGLYADTQLSIACSGTGDQILKHMVAADIAKYYASGQSLKEAVLCALRNVAGAETSCAVAAIDADGNCVIESTARLFSVASGSSWTSTNFGLQPDTLPILPLHEMYHDDHVLIGHSRYPTTPGHTVAVIQRDGDLFSLPRDDFVCVLNSLRRISSVLQKLYKVERCALITEGGNSLSLLPLHGLSNDWKPVTSDLKEFHETFPGYISSKDGPPMAQYKLGAICSTIQAVSQVAKPFNNRFDGANDDKNLFARIIRGDLSQWRVWEDDNHVAFLTPFPNTPGFTVLVPRKHLFSDIFSIDEESYTALMVAAHKLATILKKAFETSQCGMIFEGFEIDYAHVKLVPIHQADSKEEGWTNNKPWGVASFNERYQGYVISLDGPLSENFGSIKDSSLEIRGMLPGNILRPPKSWKVPSRQLSCVLQDPWYKSLFILQDILFHTSVSFFHDTLGYRYCFVPTTTNSPSSPMGLGSDSEPVPVVLLGQQTYLADSMQFALEYSLRIQDGLPGVYYLNTSFRGEDPDAMHLNQFYHVECELLGPLPLGISVAERYIVNLVIVLLQDRKTTVKRTAGTVEHLESFLDHYCSNGRKLPQITLDKALNLSIIDESCWKYVVPSDPDKGRALNRAGEVKLIKHFGGAVWLTEMDHLSVPFYQAFTDETQTKARCADLLLGNGEVLGLGERHKKAKDVLKALRKHEVDPEGYSWYTDIRDQKPVLTTGWGMGIERFLAWVFAHDDIRDLTLVPRMKGFSFAP